MKKIVMLISLTTFIFANTNKDLYDIDNKVWVKDKQEQYKLKANNNTKIIKCIESKNEEKEMKKCLNK